MDAAIEQKFYTRVNVFDDKEPIVEELTIQEIFEGKGDYVGLNSILETYIEKNSSKFSEEAGKNSADPILQARTTFKFFRALASGEVKTTARRLREFLLNHEEYKNDSILTKVRKITKLTKNPNFLPRT